MPDRSRYITVRASEEESAMLHMLAEADGLSASDYLRQYIRKTYKTQFGDKKPKK